MCFQLSLPRFVENSKESGRMDTLSYTWFQTALLFFRVSGQGKVSAFLKTGPWELGSRVEMATYRTRVGVSLILVSEVGV
jgi:hypothetical protein